ncbi:hypothetical protein JMJ56_00175 [Belnapia sp. T18]|uniref:Uncharacterized protein n=1 Tax=Belnapia arida TaxID=2804533 RepID=A0ABS1TW36_9PROT|nr:hypothetical protein [Belnapia arida]MBL6076395.1 hypothetical protein [Belnapia arida]
MRLSTALAGAFLTMLAAGAAAGTQYHPVMPGLFGLIGNCLRGGPPDSALLAFDVLDEAEFLALLEPEAPSQ